MAGFLERLILHQKKNKARAVNFDFFKACMAAAALITLADGRRDRREDASLKAMFRTLDQLKTYRRRQGEELYNEYIEDLEEGGDKGRTKVLGIVEAVKEDEEWAALLVAICATVSEADGKVDEEESAIIEQISASLGLDAAAIKAFEVRFDNELYE